MTWSTFWMNDYWVPNTMTYNPKLKKYKMKVKIIKPIRKGCWL